VSRDRAVGAAAANEECGERHSEKGPRAILRPAASVYRFDIDDGLLLFDRRSNAVLAYNDTARHIWDLIQAGCQAGNVVREFARTWGIPVSLARSDVESLVAQWRLHKLLADEQEPTAAPQSDARVECHDLPLGPATEWTCAFGAIHVAFATEEEIGPVRLMLSQFETAPGEQPTARLDLRRAETGEMVLLKNGVQRIRTGDRALLLGGLTQAILEFIYPSAQWLALIHGAAVARDGAAFALLGPSGSGKTTLTAGLIGNGFRYLADDLVAVMEPQGAIAPWPVPLSVKDGSVELLARLWPELEQAKTYRAKGLAARMLAPPSSSRDFDPVRLDSLIFVQYRKGHSPALQRISRFQTIERLLSDRIWVGNPITIHRVSALLEWLRVTPAYVCTYGSLQDGMRLVRELVQ
jgi:hypothetical protein